MVILIASFMKKIGQNFYEIMLKQKEHFDLSNFPKASKSTIIKKYQEKRKMNMLEKLFMKAKF